MPLWRSKGGPVGRWLLLLALSLVLSLAALAAGGLDRAAGADGLDPAAAMDAFRATRLRQPVSPGGPQTLTAAAARRIGAGLDLTGCRLSALPGLPGPVSGAHRRQREATGDLDRDRQAETYTLSDGCLIIRGSEGILWQSPAEWWVDDSLLGDLTGDGVADLCLSVWKVGSFGPHRPFWVQAEDQRIRNHCFVFNLDAGSIRAVWQSSNLARPNLALFISDRDGDGRSELYALEGDYDDPAARQLTGWQWNGWGFSQLTANAY